AWWPWRCANEQETGRGGVRRRRLPAAVRGDGGDLPAQPVRQGLLAARDGWESLPRRAPRHVDGGGGGRGGGGCEESEPRPVARAGRRPAPAASLRRPPGPGAAEVPLTRNRVTRLAGSPSASVFGLKGRLCQPRPQGTVTPKSPGPEG